MWHFSPGLTRRRSGDGLLSGRLGPVSGPLQAANANIFLTRTSDARRRFAARPSIFERAFVLLCGASVGAWREVDDNAHVGRRAPPGGNPGGRDQGKSNRGI